MAGWSANIRFGRVTASPLGLLPRLAKTCAEFSIQSVCPLGWNLDATSRQRKESEGFGPLLEQRHSLRSIRNERRIVQAMSRFLEDSAYGGIMLSYDWDAYETFFSDNSRMHPPAFHWSLCPQETHTVVLLTAEHSMRHLSLTSAWQAWFSNFLDQATASLSAGRWEFDDDDSDVVYASLD